MYFCFFTRGSEKKNGFIAFTKLDISKDWFFGGRLDHNPSYIWRSIFASQLLVRGAKGGALEMVIISWCGQNCG